LDESRNKRKRDRASASKRAQRKTQRELLRLFNSAIRCNSQAHVDASAAMARSLSLEGMTQENYLLFFLFLETNNKYVIESVLGERNPLLLFSSIRPNRTMLRMVFRQLAQFKRNEINPKFLLALLGVIENAYKTSRFGYRIYPLSISDVYGIGKYLHKDQGQKDALNHLILDILFNIYFVGINSAKESAKQVAVKANAIRMAFFDNTKHLTDAIPHVLLLNDYKHYSIEPKNFKVSADLKKYSAYFPPENME
jgi:hypothetical protein